VTTSNQSKLPEDFECVVDLPDDTCAAKQGKLLTTPTHLTCELCGGQVVAIVPSDDDIDMDISDEDADDDDGDYVDEVTVAESESTIKGQTPEEAAAIRAFTGIDNIKNTCRTSTDPEITQFGTWVNENKFIIRDMYMVLQARNFFTSGVNTEKRIMSVIVAQATYIDPYEIPSKVYEFLNFNETLIRRNADRAYEDYTGDTESRVLMWIRLYGNQLGYPKESIDMAIAMWEESDPVYVAVDEKIRAAVWVALTHSKLTNKKINRAAVSRATGVDARTIKRVQDKFAPYFE